MTPDDKICYCYNVPYRKLWSFACRQRLQRASQLSECLGAGTGCGWCIPILKKLFEQSQEAQGATGYASTPSAPDVIEMTTEEYAARRDQYIRNKHLRNRF